VLKFLAQGLQEAGVDVVDSEEAEVVAVEEDMMVVAEVGDTVEEEEDEVVAEEEEDSVVDVVTMIVVEAVTTTTAQVVALGVEVLAEVATVIVVALPKAAEAAATVTPEVIREVEGEVIPEARVVVMAMEAIKLLTNQPHPPIYVDYYYRDTYILQNQVVSSLRALQTLKNIH